MPHNTTQKLLISNRGNVEGRRPDRENNPAFIMEAIALGFDVKVDLWETPVGMFFGTDGPIVKYKVDTSDILGMYEHVWFEAHTLHAVQTLIRLSNESKKWIRFFCRGADGTAVVSTGEGWTVETEPPVLLNTIWEISQDNPNKDLALWTTDLGVCSDNVQWLRMQQMTYMDTVQRTERTHDPSKHCIKLLIFDLDGVLVESKEIHYKALNLALAEIDEKFVITRHEHETTYDGLSTRQKLELLTAQKGLPTSAHGTVWDRKQYFTQELYATDIVKDERMMGVFDTLRKRGMPIAVASNCIRMSVILLLRGIGVMPWVNAFFSNEDVARPKPDPQLYTMVCERFGVHPSEALVMEDNANGRQAAVLAGCHLCKIEIPEDTTVERITAHIDAIERITMKDVVNLVIPIAARGMQYHVGNRGQPVIEVPSTLADLDGMPVLRWAIDNLRLTSTPFRFIFIVRADHAQAFNLPTLLTRLTDHAPTQVVTVPEHRDGAVRSLLEARHLIDNDNPIIIANANQMMEWPTSVDEWASQCTSGEWSGGILTHEVTHPNHNLRWSFACVDDGEAEKVAFIREKEAISTHALTGVFIMRTGKMFCELADVLMKKDRRVNGMFYTSLVFDEAVIGGHNIRATSVAKMWPLVSETDRRSFASLRSEFA